MQNLRFLLCKHMNFEQDIFLTDMGHFFLGGSILVGLRWFENIF